MDFMHFDESNPSYRFVKSLGALTALLEYAGVPQTPFRSVIKDALIPARLKGEAMEAFRNGKGSIHLAVRKNNYSDFAQAYLRLQEKMSRDLSLWNKNISPKFKDIKPSDLWKLRK